MSTTRMNYNYSTIGLLLLVVACNKHHVSAAAPDLFCVRTVDCEAKLSKGSICQGGLCTNPFYEKGCLATLMPPELKEQFSTRLRTCTSVDPPAAVGKYCQLPALDLDYQEMRIYTQNWESVFIEAWILQILLTEVLGVPVTLESGVEDVKLDFHDQDFSFGYGSGNDYSVVENAVALNGDCTMAGTKVYDNATSTYMPCAHFVPEVWTTQMQRLTALKDQGVIEQPEGLGVVGQMAWWVPAYSAKHDPSLLTHFGLTGQRQKLADTFKRPTTWGDYCAQVSITNCHEPDGIANRAPLDEAEAGQYFDATQYKGHFRKTEENDCGLHPDTCTGHIADFPCGWSSFVEQQTWHLDIALRSSGNAPGCRGYTYGELLDIFAAANATKSDFIFQWWYPDAIHNMYAGTDTEFQAVGMPAATLECIENTVTSVERCDPDPLVRRGSKEGACGEPPYPLQKVYASNLYDITQGGTITEAQKNPAYDLFKSFSLTSLQLSDLYDRWLERGTSTAVDLRYAACEWMVDNWDLMQTFIPRNFPRIPQEFVHEFDQPLYLAAVILTSLAGLVVIVSAILTFVQRERPSIKASQVGFLYILLGGLFLVTVGSVFSFLQPSMWTCNVTNWAINLGYTMALVPLIVKVAAIQKLMAAARQMRRVSLNMRDLYAVVFGICFLVVVFQGLWTIIDAPDKVYHYQLSNEQTNQGETIILMTPYCKSDSDIWLYLALLWHSVLLIAATLLAFQTRKLKTDFSETETLGIMVYSHFVFVALRMLTYTMQDEESEADAALFRSLIYSCDVVSAVCIYFVPKFLHKEGDKGVLDLRSNSVHGAPSKGASSSNPNVQHLHMLSNNAGVTSILRNGQEQSLGTTSSSHLKSTRLAGQPAIPSILEVAEDDSSLEDSSTDEENMVSPAQPVPEQWQVSNAITDKDSTEDLSTRLSDRLERLRGPISGTSLDG